MYGSVPLLPVFHAALLMLPFSVCPPDEDAEAKDLYGSLQAASEHCACLIALPKIRLIGLVISGKFRSSDGISLGFKASRA